MSTTESAGMFSIRTTSTHSAKSTGDKQEVFVDENVLEGDIKNTIFMLICYSEEFSTSPVKADLDQAPFHLKDHKGTEAPGLQ